MTASLKSLNLGTRVGIADSLLCDLHADCGPEVAGRTRTIREKLSGLPLVPLESMPATETDLSMVHTPVYIHKIRKACTFIGDKPSIRYVPDVYINTHSYNAACAAAGCVISAVNAVQSGKVKHVFCNVRPPGHHAGTNSAAGFCLFNNVAVGVMQMRRQRPQAVIAVVDWDVHHGNGTEQILKTINDPNIHFFSLHNALIYPGTGKYSTPEKRITNVPLPHSGQYREAFDQRVIKPLQHFKPEVIFISCGFDAHVMDPLGQFGLTNEDYAWMTQRLLSLVSQEKQHIISVLEGGYNVTALRGASRAHVETLISGISGNP